MAESKYQFETLSREVIGACIEVQRDMGRHGMEVDYQRALEVALENRGIECEREIEIPVTFQGVTVSKRRVDFLIWRGDDELILEIKARSVTLPEDVEQCLLYLKHGKYRVCLLVNFGEKPLDPKRFVNSAGLTRKARVA